jgi:hypothetical protein
MLSGSIAIMHSLSRLLLMLLPGLLLFPSGMRAETVVISSKVFNGYARERQPDGTYKPESYAFGEGGRWTRPINDPGMEKLKFIDIARVVAGPLAKLNYQPAVKPEDTKLLILVFWGSTQGSTGVPQEFKAAIDSQNARILGYSEKLAEALSSSRVSFAQDIRAEVGENRYYVVLEAFDFTVALKEKKLRPLWITRMSVSDRGAFVPVLEQMVHDATNYFGHDSDGLQRDGDEPKGTVDLAPLKILEVNPAKK